MNETHAPLDGIRVIAISQFGAGPYATMLLADLGAEIIKIEDPQSGCDVARYIPPGAQDGDSLYFQSFNRGKKSLTLDLRKSMTFLENNRPDRHSVVTRPNYGFWYGHYYAAQAMYQSQFAHAGGKRSWRDWNDTNRRHFLAMQKRNGAWVDEIGGWNREKNSYATAMACLILSIPRGYLPIFQN